MLIRSNPKRKVSQMSTLQEVTPDLMDEYLYGDFIYPLHEGSYRLEKGRMIGYAFEDSKLVITLVHTHYGFGVLDAVEEVPWHEDRTATYGYVVPRLASRDDQDRLIFASPDLMAVIIHP